MKILKHLFTALLLMVATVAMAHDFEVGGIYYRILSEEEKTVEVTYRGYNYSSYSNEYTGSVDIPSSVIRNGITYAVTSIGYRAFYNCSGLTSVTIPNSVTSIRESAFEGSAWYNNLPDGVVYAGKVLYTYKGTMPENTNIAINEGTLGIAGSAFCDCTGLASITIPNSVTSIGEGAFEGCTGLKKIELDCSTIGSWFSGRSSIEEVIIGNNVTRIGTYAFEECTGLKEVHISDIAAWCNIDFYNLYANPLYHANNLYLNGELITDLVIPDNITIIKSLVFAGCTGLTSVTIPNSVTSIGEGAFEGCTGLKKIELDCSTIGSWFSGRSSIEEVIIGNNVTSIGTYAFRGCTGLISVTIPNSVTSIGDEAFRNCSGLTSVTIPNSVTSIGTYAFLGCTGLTSVTIPNSVTSIGSYAFRDCTGLTSVTIPNSVTSIGSYAFRDCI